MSSKSSGRIANFTLDAPPAANRLRLVLSGPQRATNCGQAARALANFGFSRLALVQPEFALAEARITATHAEQILDSATTHDTLAAALEGASVVFGTTARRASERAPAFNVRAAAGEIAALLTADGSREIALVFGPEHRGLNDAELDLCSHTITIPTAPEQPSLNLAQAVTLTSWEIFTALTDPPPASFVRAGLADHAALQGLVAHIEQMLSDIGFTPPLGHEHVQRLMRDFIYRAAPDIREVTILRGIVSRIQFWSDTRAKERMARRGSKRF